MLSIEITHHALIFPAVSEFWAVAAVPLLTLLWAVHTWWVRPQHKTFKNKGIFLELDAANNTLRIESEQDTRALSLKLGCGRIEFTPLYGTKTEEKWRRGSSGTVTLFDAGFGMKTGTVTAPTEGRWEKSTYQNLTGFMRITFFQLDPTLHFYQQWANHPDTDLRYVETTIATFELRTRTARALQRWVHAHRHVLIPSEKMYRAKWEQSCKQLLEECRQSPCVRKLKKPLEVFDYSTAPAIRYLAIGEKGEVCLKTLEGNIFHELDLGQVQGEGTTLIVVLPNGWKERFTLKGVQVSQLHRIRRTWQNSKLAHSLIARSSVKQASPDWLTYRARGLGSLQFD